MEPLREELLSRTPRRLALEFDPLMRLAYQHLVDWIERHGWNEPFVVACTIFVYVASTLLFLRKEGPNTLSTNGIGSISVARQARSVPAHCTPRFANICLEKRGNPAATAERSIMLAATVEAALRKASESAGAYGTWSSSKGTLTLGGTRQQDS